MTNARMTNQSPVATRTPAEIRAQAARLVMQVADQGRSLDGMFARGKEGDQQTGLARSLVYGTVRWHSRLTAVLGKLSARPIADLDAELRALLLVGLFQLLHTDIAVHAVVAETVEAARVLNHAKAAGFVNAILRRCQREGAGIAAALDADLGIRTAHPAWLVKRLQSDWPERYQDILDANNRHPPMWLRVNCRVTTQDYLQRLQAAGHPAQLSEFVPQAIRLESPTDVRNLPEFAGGDVSVQDAAAQFAAHLLAAQPQDRVLDACAAPGGKTCHILELQPALKELVAIDVSAARLRRVEENLARLSLHATLLAGDASDPDSWWDGKQFQRILLDVPCSATGVIRRHPDIKLLRRPADCDELARRQATLLERLWPLLAPGGRLLYASCSALRAETTEVVGAFLLAHPDACDATARELAARLPKAHEAFADVAPGRAGLAIAAGEAQMDGFYYACLDKDAAATG